jgi:hypothetical protein
LGYILFHQQDKGHSDMNEPNVQQNTEDPAKQTDVVAAASSPTVGDDKQKTEAQKHTNISTNKHAETKLKAWLMQLWKASADRQIELALAAAITFFAAAQWITSRENNSSTSIQANALINTASSMATAASGFAGSADKINTGIGNAVINLAQQATAAQTANSNALQSGRPWMGAQFEVTGFTLGKTPTYTISYVNTGGRPAIVTAAFNHAGAYEEFPTDPDKEYGPSPGGVNFVVPGQPYIMANPGIHPLTESQMSQMGGPKTLYVFGKVEYTDPRTGDHYWTHVCYRYLPAYAGSGNSGFRSCHQYNDAK